MEASWRVLGASGPIGYPRLNIGHRKIKKNFDFLSIFDRFLSPTSTPETLKIIDFSLVFQCFLKKRHFEVESVLGVNLARKTTPNINLSWHEREARTRMTNRRALEMSKQVQENRSSIYRKEIRQESQSAVKILIAPFASLAALARRLVNVFRTSWSRLWRFLFINYFFITLGRLGRVLEASWRVCKYMLELKSPENNKSLIVH